MIVLLSEFHRITNLNALLFSNLGPGIKLRSQKLESSPRTYNLAVLIP
jgi:hypothetical protein